MVQKVEYVKYQKTEDVNNKFYHQDLVKELIIRHSMLSVIILSTLLGIGQKIFPEQELNFFALAMFYAWMYAMYLAYGHYKETVLKK